MAETNVVTLSLVATIAQTLDAASTPGATTPRITHSAFNTSATLNATSTPAVTKSAVNTADLSAGTLSLDLEALTGTNGATVDGSGLRVQVIKIRNHEDNTAAIVIAADDWDGLGGSLAGLTIPVGGEFTAYIPEGGTDINGTDNSTITITSSDLDATIEYAIAMG